MACNSSNTENLSSIVANMALAHEMIMNDDFQFKAISEVTENSLQKNVHDIVHRAFWDVLESEVTSNPPQYKNAFNLLMEMKTLVLEIIPEKGESIRKEVEDYLDRDLISQQIEHDTFDVYNCASCVLGTLSKLCAPVRDETVSQLKEETNLVSLLRGTFELINLIKMDIANYELKTVKPILIQQAVEYEKAKFMDYLRENINGLQRTKIWLKNTMNIIKLLQKPESATKMTPGMTITHAYLSLMTPTETYIIPETLLLDELRLLEMSHTFEKLAYVISILTYCLNSVSKHLSTDQNFVKHLKDIILILLGDIKWNEQTMESIFSQVTAETDKESEKRLIEVDPKIDRSVLNKQLKDLLEPKNHLKQLISEDFKWSPEYAAQSSKTSCKPLKRYESSSLKNKIIGPSLNRTSLGSVVNSEVCGGLCCEMESCDMAEFNDKHCYAIQCVDLKSCEISPSNGESEILTFTRRAGTDIWTRGLKESKVLTQAQATVQKSEIPKDVIATADEKDSVISTSTKDKPSEPPMDQLLKEELRLVHNKELEKENAWSLSNEHAGIVKNALPTNLGKEIQSITGEHYLKAEDKSDITALQENDTSTAHTKHPHRKDLRHTLISPITIGAFTCMTVIAVSGFAMAIIKYKKERKDVEDKQTQLP